MAFDSTSDGRTREGDRTEFLGSATFDRTRLFADGDRLPNVVVAMDGTVLATWGGYQWPDDDHGLRARRSLDGGGSWSEPIPIGDGEHGGGVLVDESSGAVLAFIDYRDDDREPDLYRSTDHGQTWDAIPLTIEADQHGNVPSLHMAEHGITLQHGLKPGRLIRPARVYGDRGYNTAIYSDDCGRTWQPSAPFPIRGTGEGAIAELTDGRIYYSSRQHHFPAQPFRSARLYALSDDGGEHWHNPTYADAIPDVPRHRSAEGRGACYNGHFGMMGGLTRLPISGEDVLVYSNADNDGHQRRNISVWVSFDGGATWPVKRIVDDGPAAYSSIEAGRPGTQSAGTIYLFYEDGTMAASAADTVSRIRYAGGTLAAFNLSWLARGTATADGTIPSWVEQ